MPRYIPRPKFDVPSLNAFQLGDLLFLSHDKLPHDCKVFKYALTVVDVASCYKEAEPLTSKESAEVAKAFPKTYKRRPLKWPQLLQGAVAKEMEKNKVPVRRGRVDIHRDPAILERFKCTLAEHLFGPQYAVEMRLPDDKKMD